MRNQVFPNINIIEIGIKKEIEKLATIQEISLESAFEKYVRYVLYSGTKFERTRLVRNIGAKLMLHERSLVIDNLEL